MKTIFSLIAFLSRQKPRLIFLLPVLLIIVSSLHAHDGKINPIPVKKNVPVNYYQAFMISIAGAYGIYLLLRARKRRKAE